MEKIIGIGMIWALFIGLFIFASVKVGILKALFAFGITFLIVLFISLATYLICK
jgi:hypothetical protein